MSATAEQCNAAEVTDQKPPVLERSNATSDIKKKTVLAKKGELRQSRATWKGILVLFGSYVVNVSAVGWHKNVVYCQSTRAHQLSQNGEKFK